MKKIVDIEYISVTEIVEYVKQGWKLYGQPHITSGASGFNIVPAQTVVKYSDEEVGENIVECIYIFDYSSHDIMSGEKVYADVCKKAKEYIKLGYQPYGQVIADRREGGIYYETLVMLKYE